MSRGYLQKLLTVACLAVGPLILASAVFTPSAYSEAVPSHLAKMAGSLYKSTADALRKPGKNLKATEMRKRALEILRKAGVHRWAGGPVSIDKAVEKGGTRTALISTGDGEEIELKWFPDIEIFLINIKTKPDKNSPEYDITTLKGKVKTRVKKKNNGDGKELVLEVEPEEKPIQTSSSEELSAIKGNIFGEWVDEHSGDIYQISSSIKQDGEVRPGREFFDKQISEIKKKVGSLKSAKIYKWKNPDTGEIIRQEKFQRLKEPYEYMGEELAQKGAKAKIAKLNKKISELEKERDGGNLPPIDKHDPAGYSKISANENARPVTVTVKQPDGYSYTYDKAVFDGRRASAKRTRLDIRDISNKKLPQAIRRMLVTDGWNPAGWMEIAALVDAETGEVSMQGLVWSLHVTWGRDGAFGSGNLVIHSIHTPYPILLSLTRPGQGDSLKIGKLKISYVGWKVEKGFLKSALMEAESKLKKIIEELDDREEKNRPLQNDVYALNGELKYLTEEVSDRYKKLKVVEPSAKTKKYLALKLRVEKAEKWIDRKFASIEYMKKQPRKNRDLIFSLREEILAKDVKLKELRQRLAKERADLGIDKERAERRKKIELTEDKYWEKRLQVIHAEGKLHHANTMQEFELNEYIKAKEEHGKALNAYNQLTATGVPLVTEIKNDYYLAQLWNPGEEINKLNKNIRLLRTSLKSLRKRRSENRDKLVAAGDVMTVKSDELVSAIWKSNLAQAGVEVADFARDMYDAAKAGPQGLLALSVKKILELSVFGPPTYYDSQFDLTDHLPTGYMDVGKKVGKRMVKTAMGAPFKAGVEKLVANQELKIYSKMIGRLYEGTWLNDVMNEYPNMSMEKSADNIMKILEKQDNKLAAATKKFQTSIGKKGKLALGKKLGASFAKGVLKDIAKEALKKEAAEFFEGRAMMKYALAQYELQGTVTLMIRTSNQFWMTKDAYDTLVAIRNAIAEKYDPITQMVVDRNKTARFLGGPKPYKILIADNYKPAGSQSPRKMEVILGGVKAVRDASGALIFTIPAKEIKNVKNRKKGAELQIKVIK